MKIALDAQLLFEEQKTGVGWNATRLIETLLDDGIYEYDLFYFSKHCPLKKKREFEEHIIGPYRRKKCSVIRCGFVKSIIYRLTRKWLGIPFHFFIPTDADVLQFFNFTIPQGIDAKTVTIVHDMAYKAIPEAVPKKTQMWLQNWLPRTCRQCSVIATVSSFSKSEIMKYLGIEKSKIEVVYSGVDTDIYRPMIDRSVIQDVLDKYHIKGKYFLYVGTLEPRKNVTKIIEAYVEYKRRSPEPAILVLVGKKGWMYDEIFREIRDLGIEADVIITGYMKDEDKRKMIQGASVFVFPSKYEGFGTPPLEAMACGVPVISSNMSSLPEVVGEGGILVNPDSAGEIADAMVYLMDNCNARYEMGRKAFAQAQRFTWEKTAERMRQIYKRLSES